MLVSIITVYYNRVNQVKESIQSLLDQTYANTEIILVDDGSTDGTLQALEAFQDPRIRLISHSNRGFTRSVIEAVKQSRGEVVAIHGSGDISFPQRIEEQVKVLQSRPDVGVVGCIVENVNKVTNTTTIYNKYKQGIKGIDQLLQNNFYTHGEVMFRRDAYEQAGGYRELFKFTQDYDLWLRMGLVTEFALVEKLLYRRYTLPDGVSGSVEKMMVQQYLAELGRQCAELRIREGRDLIDRYGVHALFFLKRSKRLALKLFNLGVSAIVNERDMDKAKRLVQLSLEQNWTARGSVLSGLLAVLTRFEGGKKAMLSMLLLLRQVKKKVEKAA
ncbi:family 2 glycosyl transferase [Paenibacillus sp. BIHB 4019]|uniref:Family 2 glycosyl transferase n=1 Tax=Paenibacillus sp. BIHB 4019 TaxID=1870819 RepID=A0A1B2DHZ0_9BACL|nr:MULTISPECIES: glycosyltransferase [unclassified Paenibacillus]ANY67338.1 family 2 glycosyl transferase [Paenibacillus sp. BIHB 4019]KQO15788.1 family 2 glycosyl transferase [Paenibacillus sp. Leaf72]